jgi:hypothetical protein
LVCLAQSRRLRGSSYQCRMRRASTQLYLCAGVIRQVPPQSARRRPISRAPASAAISSQSVVRSLLHCALHLLHHLRLHRLRRNLREPQTGGLLQTQTPHTQQRATRRQSNATRGQCRASSAKCQAANGESRVTLVGWWWRACNCQNCELASVRRACRACAVVPHDARRLPRACCRAPAL